MNNHFRNCQLLCEVQVHTLNILGSNINIAILYKKNINIIDYLSEKIWVIDILLMCKIVA